MEAPMPSFASYVASETKTEQDTQPQEPVTPVLQEQEVVSQETQATTTTPAAEPAEQATPSMTAESVDGFKAFLASMGADVDAIDPEDLYQSAHERIIAAAQLEQELARLRAELEAAKQVPAAPQQTPVAPTAPVEQQIAERQAAVQEQLRQKRFKQLTPPDPNLHQMVTTDEKTGLVVGRPEWGNQGMEAARTINEYVRAEKEQANLLLTNPYALVDDFKDEFKTDFEKLVEQRAKAIVEAELNQFRQAQQKAQEEAILKRQQDEAAQRQQAWHEQNKKHIFKLAPDGSELRDLNQRLVFTETGKAFKEALDKLRERFPNADELALRDTALEQALIAKPAPAPAVPAAKQRQQFVQQRQAIVPNQNTPAASIAELESDRPGAPKFSDWARRNPETQELISAWAN